MQTKTVESSYFKVDNAIGSLLWATWAADDDFNKGGNEEIDIRQRSQVLCQPVVCTKHSLWWEGFELHMTRKHQMLHVEHSMCLMCSIFLSPEAGIGEIRVC